MKLFMGKITVVMMTVILLFGGVGSAYAQTPQVDENGMTTEDYYVADLLMEHLVIDEDTQLFHFNNEEASKESLQPTSTNFEDVKSDIENLNEQLKLVTSEESDGEFSTASGCSAALGLLGLWHGVQMNAAMLILGVVSTPALFAVTTLTGAIWVGGALLCP